MLFLVIHPPDDVQIIMYFFFPGKQEPVRTHQQHDIPGYVIIASFIFTNLKLPCVSKRSNGRMPLHRRVSPFLPTSPLFGAVVDPIPFRTKEIQLVGG